MTDTLTEPRTDDEPEISGRQTGLLVLRVTLILAAILSAGLNGPVVLTTVLTALAALVVTEALVRRRELGWEDGLLVGIAGAVIVLILLGLVLNLLPSGLGAVPWAVGVEVPAIVAVVYVWWTSADAPPFALAGLNWTRIARSAPWYVAATAVVIVAIAISVHATDTATRAPASLDLGQRSGNTVSIGITGGPTAARVELTTRTASGPLSYQDAFELGAGEKLTRPVTVPAGRRVVVDLRDADSDRVLGSLVVQGTS